MSIDDELQWAEPRQMASGLLGRILQRAADVGDWDHPKIVAMRAELVRREWMDGSAVGALLTVDQVVKRWPQVRQEVKAINRRIDAILTTIDPAAVNGDLVTLVTPYEFHCQQMNRSDVRAVVEAVISRVTGQRVQVICVLRDQFIHQEARS